MKRLLIPVVASSMLLSGQASAGLSTLNATCPGDLSIHVDEGGPVYINGKEAVLKRSNENYYEAHDAELGVTISISNNPDGSSDVSYTGRNRANGVCQVVEADISDDSNASTGDRESHPAAENACLDAVAEKVNISRDRLSVIEALGGEAGISVTIQVPDADAPWACITDKNGHPSSVIYTGSEGAL